MKKNQIKYDELWNHLIANMVLSIDSIHGPNHWKSVEKNGLYILKYTGANALVVRLFALFHDSRRLNNSQDKNHGLRGAEFAKQLRNKFFKLEDNLFDLLYDACAGHTDQIFSNEITIATCWDADRLDLNRTGIRPDPSFLNTDVAKNIAENTNYNILKSNV